MLLVGGAFIATRLRGVCAIGEGVAPATVRRLGAGLLWGILLIGSGSGAEDPGDAAAQANHPLVNMTALNFQDYYIGRLTETDEDGNQL